MLNVCVRACIHSSVGLDVRTYVHASVKTNGTAIITNVMLLRTYVHKVWTDCRMVTLVLSCELF